MQMHSEPRFKNCAIAQSFEMSLGMREASSLLLAMRRVDLLQRLLASMNAVFAPAKHGLLSNQPSWGESAGTIWFCDRLPCRGQVHGAGHACKHAALLSQRSDMPHCRWRL